MSAISLKVIVGAKSFRGTFPKTESEGLDPTNRVNLTLKSGGAKLVGWRSGQQ